MDGEMYYVQFKTKVTLQQMDFRIVLPVGKTLPMQVWTKAFRIWNLSEMTRERDHILGPGQLTAVELEMALHSTEVSWKDFMVKLLILKDAEWGLSK